eukprot:291954-Amphidinium_carterae.1
MDSDYIHPTISDPPHSIRDPPSEHTPAAKFPNDPAPRSTSGSQRLSCRVLNSTSAPKRWMSKLDGTRVKPKPFCQWPKGYMTFDFPWAFGVQTNPGNKIWRLHLRVSGHSAQQHVRVTVSDCR